MNYVIKNHEENGENPQIGTIEITHQGATLKLGFFTEEYAGLASAMQAVKNVYGFPNAFIDN